MNRLAKLIRELPMTDVELIKRDIEEGNLSRAISERLAELELPQKVCPVCNSAVDDNAPYVLFFGESIREKARFDGKDCLLFFLKDNA